MTSLERVTAALQGEPVDRVPVALHGLFAAADLLQRPFGEVFRSGELMARSQLALYEAVGHDAILLENGTCALAEACGCRVVYSESGSPVIMERPLARLDRERVRLLQVPDPDSSTALRELLEATRIVSRELGDRVFVMGRADQAPFVLASQLAGPEHFLESLATPERCPVIHELLEYCTEACLAYARAQLRRGAHATSFGDSFAGPEVISPAAYRAFAYPYAKRVIDQLKKEGVPVAYHICGRTDPIFADMVSLDCAILEIDQKTDRLLARDAARGRTCILGPIDPSAVIHFGSPDQVAAECQKALQVFAPAGGYILGSGCDIPPGTPLENLRAMVRAAEGFKSVV